MDSVIQQMKECLRSNLYDNYFLRYMVIQRMNLLLDEAGKFENSIDWIHLSSLLFGTLMVHNVAEQQADPGMNFAANAWFQAFLFNFGEVLDRIKLFAILQEHG